MALNKDPVKNGYIFSTPNTVTTFSHIFFFHNMIKPNGSMLETPMQFEPLGLLGPEEVKGCGLGLRGPRLVLERAPVGKLDHKVRHVAADHIEDIHRDPGNGENLGEKNKSRNGFQSHVKVNNLISIKNVQDWEGALHKRKD